MALDYEDVFYLTGNVTFLDDPGLREGIERVYGEERGWTSPPA